MRYPTGPSRVRLAAFAATILLVASACGSSPVASGSPGPSEGQTSFDPRAPLDTTHLAALVPAAATDETQLGQQAAALGAADRAEVNAAVVVDPSIPSLEAAADQNAMAAVQALKAKLPVALTQPAAAQLAVWRPVQSPSAAAPQNALLSNTFFLVITLMTDAVAGYDPRVEIQPKTITLDVPSSSANVTSTTRVTLTGSSSGGRVSQSMTVDSDAEKTDPATGAIVGRVVGTSTYTMSINPCPDPAGKVQGTIAFSDDETDFSATVAQTTGYGYRYKGTADFTTTVNDQAEIADTSISAQIERSMKGGTRAAGASQADITATNLDFQMSQDVGAGGPGPLTVNVTSSDGPATEADGRSLGWAYAVMDLAPALLFSEFSKKVWRAGKCFEIRPSPDGGDVSPSSTTSIKVAVYHWVDKADIKVPVQATLAGTKTIDPSGTNQTSPATFTFTAGQPSSTGDVTYKVVSNRGIAEKTSHFIVQGGLLVDIAGTLNESGGGIVNYRLKITARAISVRANPDGSLAVSGNVTVSGTASGTIYPCTGTINERIGVQGSGTLTGPEDAPVYHVLIGPASTSNLGGSFQCGPIAVRTNAGDFFGQWSSTLGPVDLPAAGGTVSKAGSTSGLLTRSAKGTFTATPK